MLEGSVLKQLADHHRGGQDTKQRPLNFGVYYKNTLVALCHALEDSILDSSFEPVMITAFQQGKWYLQEADRYGAIADKSEQVVIMATPDGQFESHPTSQKPNVSVVSLDATDPVAQEWHLIIVSPTYTAMVLCQELSDEDYGHRQYPQTDLERKFYGFWTFEPQLVVEAARVAIAKVADYNPALAEQLTQQIDSIQATIQSGEARADLPPVERVDRIVARVVDYLQHSPGLPLAVSSPSLNADAETDHHLSKNALSNELQAFLRVAQLMDQADVQNSNAGAEVAALAEAMGQLLDLPGWQVNRLRLAGLLHRLGLLQGTDAALPAPDMSPDHTLLDAPFCPLSPGTQALRTMPRLRAIATIITHQTEWWNGQGSPAKLSGDSIPLESRILGLVADFQHHLSICQPNTTVTQRFQGHLNADALQDALSQCSTHAGEQWDPKLVDVLTLLVSGLSQGMSLSVSIPKIASGLWLLDSHDVENEASLSR
ncbi:MAG: DICT sensory domain-containing protein [Cyanobacteria bacterium P01_A01_bin.37]